MNVNTWRIGCTTVLTLDLKNITLIFGYYCQNSRNSHLERAKIV